MTRILVWQWGRHGAGPRYAMELARALASLPECAVALSLSTQAELLRGPSPPVNAVPMRTYRGLIGGVARVLSAPAAVWLLTRRLRSLRLDYAICAMPAPLDLLMASALRRVGVRFAVIMHDAESHPGDFWPAQRWLRAMLARRAAFVLALSRHVAGRLIELGLASADRLVVTTHPPFAYGPMPAPPRAHGGRLRVLSFGRLLPYKGLDLLAEAVALIGPHPDIEFRVAGLGPDSAALARLRRAGVRVDNRWVPETELGALLGWADALVLSHREASQSGVAAAGLAAGRWLVATDVGGIGEQLRGQPGAVLCAPEGRALANALLGLLTQPPVVAAIDAETQWRAAAAKILAEIKARALPWTR